MNRTNPGRATNLSPLLKQESEASGRLIKSAGIKVE
jgi:hypothetical protein